MKYSNIKCFPLGEIMNDFDFLLYPPCEFLLFSKFLLSLSEKKYLFKNREKEATSLVIITNLSSTVTRPSLFRTLRAFDYELELA